MRVATEVDGTATEATRVCGGVGHLAIRAGIGVVGLGPFAVADRSVTAHTLVSRLACFATAWCDWHWMLVI